MKKSISFATIPAMLLGIVLAIVMGVFSIPAYAVDGVGIHELGLFELDGDPQDDSGLGILPDDWYQLWVDCGQAYLPNPFDPANPYDPAFPPYDPDVDGGPCGDSDRFTGIVMDEAGLSNFTGGGSKDIHDISLLPGEKKESVWLHIDGSEPDKNDITNAFTAAYQLDGDGSEWCAWVDNDILLPRPQVMEIFLCNDTNYDIPTAGLDYEVLHRKDDTVIYFGADRFTNNGDAFLGFWFFQDKIELTGDKQGGGFKFKGKHKQGDTLVLVDFPQGSGKAPVIKVYVWDADLTGLPNVDEDGHSIGPLEMIYNSTTSSSVDALCDGEGGKLACAITNADPDGDPNYVPVPAGVDDDLWPYAPKGGSQGDDYPYETFYSGGINISRLIGEGRCFSTFMAESRSSRSETAQLKDFVLGSFPLCSVTAETEIHAGSSADATPHVVIPLGSSVAVVGDTIHDTVLITGEILGSGTAPDPGVDDPDVGQKPELLDVTFTLYDDLACGDNGGAVLQTSTGTLTGNDDGTSSAYSADWVLGKIGAHSYQASWAGDVNYPAGATSACEPFNVIQPEIRILKDVNSCLADDTLDQGTFQLKYREKGDTTWINVGDPVGDGGDTGSFGVYPGTYEVDETMINKPGEYVKLKDFTCANGEVTVSGNESKACTIQNIRKPHLIIKKVIVGTPIDTGVFNLQINDVTVDSGSAPTNTSYVSGDGSEVGNGAEARIRVDSGQNTADPALFGSFTFGETAGAGTLLSGYQTSIMCDDPDQTQAVFATTATGPRKTPAINVQAGEIVTCTITNMVQIISFDCPVQ